MNTDKHYFRWEYPALQMMQSLDSMLIGCRLKAEEEKDEMIFKREEEQVFEETGVLPLHRTTTGEAPCLTTNSLRRIRFKMKEE